ncbi:3-hydroxyacyl-ACP dehydratase FabZ family protein [Streptomyces sp. NPDC054874]
MIELDGIRRLLPRRRPMLLVDRVLEAVPGESLVAVKAVTGNEPWYERIPQDASVEQLAYPPTLLIESWGQAAGLLASMDEDLPEGVMVLGGTTEMEFHRPVLPGTVLEHRVRLMRVWRGALFFRGETRVGGEAVMSVHQLTLAFRPWEALGAPESADRTPVAAA